METVAWTETQDRPGQGGGKGEVSEEPEPWQGEAATEPAELAGCAGPGGRDRQPEAKAALGGLRRLPGVSEAAYFQHLGM